MIGNLGCRGNVALESVLVVLVLALLAVGFPIASKIVSDVRDDMDADPDIGVEAKNVIDQFDNTYAATYDNLFVFIFVLLMIMVIAASVLIDTVPIFSYIVLFISQVLVVIGMAMANMHEELIVNGLSVEAATFPKTVYLMQQMPYILVVVAVMVGLALYGKKRLAQ